MEEIILRGKRVKVDVRGELERFDWGMRTKWQEDKLIAPSPFRYDKSPSFFVNLKPIEVNGEWVGAGTWKDSGYEYEEWASGNFVKLLSYLRAETYEETEEYLALTYGIELSYDADIAITGRIVMEEKRKPLGIDWLKPYKVRHPYLGTRGITEKVQRMMRIGYDAKSNAVVIPWLDSKGEVINAKFRTVKGKVFWYTKDAMPIKHNVYGMDLIYALKAERAVICEAEIDALSWMCWGVPAIAVGHSSLHDKQAELIIRSPIKQLILGTDNDAQGAKLAEQIVYKVGAYKELSEVSYPLGYKDANDVLKAGLPMPKITAYNTFRQIKLG